MARGLLQYQESQQVSAPAHWDVFNLFAGVSTGFPQRDF